MSAEARQRRLRRSRDPYAKGVQLAPKVQLTKPCAECGHAPGLHTSGLIETCQFPKCECVGFVEVNR